MALRTTVKSAVTRISKALDEFATEHGWKAGEYRVLVIVSQKWGLIRIFFIVKDFDGSSEQETWKQAWDHLEKTLIAGPDIGYSIGLSVRSWEQVNQGGMYSIPSAYRDVDDILNVVRGAN